MLTDDQIRRIRKLIEVYHLATVADLAGLVSLSEDELRAVEQAGLLPGDASQGGVIGSSYRFGRLMARDESGDPARATAARVERMLADDLPLSEFETRALAAASHLAGQWIRGLGNRVASDIQGAVLTHDKEARLKALKGIRSAVATAVDRRKTSKQLKSDLGHMMGDWSRDWDRVAGTELHNAHQQGIADTYRAQHGDPLVFKRVLPGACKSCSRLLQDEDGRPRTWKLSDLQRNGTNVGRKQADWLPVINGIHPHCHPAGTKVTTPEGDKDIERIMPGDRVVSHDGTVRRVTHVWSSYVSTSMVAIELSNGGTVRATPNHHLLTPVGWKAASAIDVQDDLVSVTLDRESSLSVELKPKNGPARVMQKGCFLRILTLLDRGGMPIVAIDFDGQLYFREGQVDIVDTDGELRVRLVPSKRESLVEEAFVGAVELSGSLLRLGGELFVACFPTPDRLVSGACVRFEPFGVSGITGFASASLCAAGSLNPAADGPSRYPHDAGYLIHREQIIEMHPQDSFSVDVDSLFCHVSVSRVCSEPFVGQVYNMTVDGTESYVADGVASHNCRCQLVRIPEGWVLDEAGDLAPAKPEAAALTGDEPIKKSLKQSSFHATAVMREARDNPGILDQYSIAKQIKRGPRLVITRGQDDLAPKPLGQRVVRRDKVTQPESMGERKIAHVFSDPESYIRRAEERKRRAAENRANLDRQHSRRAQSHADMDLIRLAGAKPVEE